MSAKEVAALKEMVMRSKCEQDEDWKEATRVKMPSHSQTS